MARGTTARHRDWLADNEKRNKLREVWAAFFQEFDLLLCPTAASTAFPHDHEGERKDRTIPINGQPEPSVDQLFWAGLSGVVNLPGTVAPAGVCSDGLPCGLQIVAPHGQDKMGIAFAAMMEREVGGFTPPPGY